MGSRKRSPHQPGGTWRWLCLFGCSAALVALSAGSASALDAAMFVVGATQQDIRCQDDPRQGRDGAFPVLAFGYSIDVPLDASTGQIQGRRQHKPVTVRIDSGCSGVPQLYHAVFTNELLRSVIIRFYRPNAEQQTENYFTLELEDAVLLGITAAGAGPQDQTQLLVSFSFKKITLTYEDGGVTAEDDWREAP